MQIVFQKLHFFIYITYKKCGHTAVSYATIKVGLCSNDQECDACEVDRSTDAGTKKFKLQTKNKLKLITTFRSLRHGGNLGGHLIKTKKQNNYGHSIIIYAILVDISIDFITRFLQIYFKGFLWYGNSARR